MRTDIPVLLLRLDHHGALGVMRSLGRLGVPVYGLHKSREAGALRSRYARGAFIWDLDEEPASRSVARLFAIAAELGADRPLLIPSNDETALFVAENAGALRRTFRFSENPPALVRGLYDKKQMHLIARSLGMPTAETHFPRHRDDVCAFAARAQFPIVLKAADGIAVARRSGEKTIIARDAEELLRHYDRMHDPARADLMLQEYIPGGVEAQWMFNGYFDDASECRFGITGRKLRQNPAYTGMSSLAVCARNDEVAALTCRFMKAIGYRGILDIGYRYDARDGRYKVLDVNPRLGATFRLFVGDDDTDVVRALYCDRTGQPIPASRACEGRKWVVEDLDLASSVRYLRDGVFGPAAWLRSFAGVREAGWFAADDLRPFVGMCGGLCARALRKLGKTVGLVPPAAPPPRQAEITRQFARAADAWRRLYDDGECLQPLAYQERLAAALRWVDELPLPFDGRALDLGCGAGLLSVALGHRGYRVHAVDTTPEMIALAHAAAERAGLGRFTAELGDAHALDFDDGSFDLVVALGLLPWLRSEARGLGEMARVLRPGGMLITTADHRAPLHRLLDPRATPALAPLRGALKRALGRDAATVEVPSKRHDPATVDRLIREAGLRKLDSTSVGFGPFSLLGKPLLSERTSVRLQHGLHALARRNWPLVRSTGAHYLVLAKKA
jgi:predicted ATP-grasp superfamily ATP-dependent carboligase/SAM-dependent methyltransferase